MATKGDKCEPSTEGCQIVDPRSKGWIKPGEVRNPKGRPKGCRHKLGEAFLEALHADFDAHGASAIVKVREEMPHQYLKVIAAILPKELKINGNAMDGLSDEELGAMIETLRETIAPIDPLVAH